MSLSHTKPAMIVRDKDNNKKHNLSCSPIFGHPDSNLEINNYHLASIPFIMSNNTLLNWSGNWQEHSLTLAVGFGQWQKVTQRKEKS